jgi:hypothetical protein
MGFCDRHGAVSFRLVFGGSVLRKPPNQPLRVNIAVHVFCFPHGGLRMIQTAIRRGWLEGSAPDLAERRAKLIVALIRHLSDPATPQAVAGGTWGE